MADPAAGGLGGMVVVFEKGVGRVKEGRQTLLKMI